MSVLTIVKAIDNFKALTTPTEPYVFEDQEATQQLCADMVDSLEHYKGYGIAANQLGLTHQVMVIQTDPAPTVVFNPQIVVYGDEQVKLEEACLSFPGMIIPIRRSKHIKVRYADQNGSVDTHTYTGLTARIFLHEFDHLQGRMWFSGCSMFHLDRAMRQAKNKGFNYYQLGLRHYASREKIS